jgi:histidinol dehydrogenase (EC 1.1.1.23)
MELEPREVADLAPADRTALFDRAAADPDVSDRVAEIIDRVRAEGDVALYRYAEELDDVTVGSIDITDMLDEALAAIDDQLRTALETAAARIESFHESQRREDYEVEDAVGTLGRRFRPFGRVAVYVPGGAAAYPSSVLMGAIPARVAGVEEVIILTPPADPMPSATLAAAAIAGADAVYAVGGAQAIAAAAYGTETIGRVQKIVGPGNRWVTAAKVAVSGDVPIDFPAGPSEIVVIADSTADPTYVAADLIAQAEHDPAASVVCLVDDAEVADAIVTAITSQCAERDRQDIIQKALQHDRSGVFIARSISEAIVFTDAYAPEHLSIQTSDPYAVADRIQHAGSIFIGGMTPVAAGDYATGPNHVLPTMGGARIYGGLSVDTFVRTQTVQELSSAGLADLEGVIVPIATTEGLEAHAHSVEIRTQRQN